MGGWENCDRPDPAETSAPSWPLPAWRRPAPAAAGAFPRPPCSFISDFSDAQRNANRLANREQARGKPMSK